MLNQLKKTCDQLSAFDLTYCILRLPSEESDDFEVDMLILEEQAKDFEIILTSMGFKYYQNSVKSHHHYIQGKLHLDLVVNVNYGVDGEYFVCNSASIISRSMFKDGLFYTRAEDELVMLLMRCMFDKKDFSKKTKRILELVDVLGEEECTQMMSKLYN